MPAVTLTLRIAEIPEDLPKYYRDDWRHWLDADRDCQNARHEVLAEESLTPVTFKTEDECRVASGSWVGPYTGTTVSDPAELDIDHMVPLANAHRSGGWAWDDERKAAYANSLDYPGHLIAAIRSANQAKSAHGPENWRPPQASLLVQLRHRLDNHQEPLGPNRHKPRSGRPARYAENLRRENGLGGRVRGKGTRYRGVGVKIKERLGAVIMLSYPVNLHFDDNDTFLVTSCDFPELTAFGNDRDDALAHAVDALEEAVAARIHDGEDIPAPSNGENMVALPALTAIKVMLYQGMREQED